MNGDAYRAIEFQLDREIETASALAATLNAERGALTGSSPDAVRAKAAEKITLFGALERQDTERRELCNAAGLTLPLIPRGSNPDMTDVPGPIAARWRNLLGLVAQCQTANEVNGYIINARRGQIGQLFQVLRGGAPSTYTAQGKTFATSLRALARA